MIISKLLKEAKKECSLKQIIALKIIIIVLFLLGLRGFLSNDDILACLGIYYFGCYVLVASLLACLLYKDGLLLFIYCIMFSFFFMFMSIYIDAQTILSDASMKTRIIYGAIVSLVPIIPTYAIMYNKLDVLSRKKNSMIFLFLIPTIIIFLLEIFPYIVS